MCYQRHLAQLGVSRLVRFIVLACIVAGLSLGPQPAAAQAAVTWVRGYPDQLMERCVWYVAQWSDGSYTATPWQCEPGVSVVQSQQRADDRVEVRRTTGGYPQTNANGCVEYVTRWSDGSFTWVPYSCPSGVVYLKSQEGGIDPNRIRINPGDPAGAPTPAPRPTIPSTPPSAPVAPGGNVNRVPASDGACPSTHPIKGADLGAAGGRIYHRPGGQFYNFTRASECFASEQDARAAGYLPSPI